LPETVSLSDRRRILSKLLDACLHSPNYDAAVPSECFQVLEKIPLPDLIAARADQFRLTDRTEDCSLAFCARLFPADLPALILRLFESDTSTWLNAAILEAFERLSADAQSASAAANGLPEKILAAFETSYANGHLTKLAELLNALDPPVGARQWTAATTRTRRRSRTTAISRFRRRGRGLEQ
jgi:hypothetical protein